MVARARAVAAAAATAVAKGSAACRLLGSRKRWLFGDCTGRIRCLARSWIRPSVECDCWPAQKRQLLSHSQWTSATAKRVVKESLHTNQVSKYSRGSVKPCTAKDASVLVPLFKAGSGGTHLVSQLQAKSPASFCSL
eukprot:scaffold267925_cov19-Tisochrysis_lutea.AAC.2